MKTKLLVIIFTCLVFTLGVSFADGGSESGQAPNKMTGSSRPVESESSDSGITKKRNSKDKEENTQKSNSEETIPIKPPAPIVPRIAPDEGC